jgi:class 3 adenylate cyclase
VRFTITELRAAGLYEPTAPDAADRLALVEWLADHGATIEQMARAARAGSLLAVATELGRASGPRLTLAEAAARTGVPVERIEAILFALGLALDPVEPTIAEDVAQSLSAFIGGEALFGREAIRRFTHVLGASLARIAEAAIAVSLVNLEGPIERRGAGDLAVAEARFRAGETSRPLADAIGHLFRAHLEVAGRRLRSVRPDDSLDAVPLTVGFVDLVGFTTLSRRMEPRELAAIVDRFEATAHDVTASHDGRVVKFVGDEVMFVTLAPEDACDIALTLVERFTGDAAVTPRGGLASGEILIRGGDYYGPIVNLAARLAELAIPREVLVNQALSAQAAGSRFRFEPAGRRMLRGFDEPVLLFTAERGRAGAS